MSADPTHVPGTVEEDRWGERFADEAALLAASPQRCPAGAGPESPVNGPLVAHVRGVVGATAVLRAAHLVEGRRRAADVVMHHSPELPAPRTMEVV